MLRSDIHETSARLEQVLRGSRETHKPRAKDTDFTGREPDKSISPANYVPTAAAPPLDNLLLSSILD
jgi:hypothetical protein